MSASAATFGLQPIRPLQSCALDHLVDMPILNLMFGRSGDAAPVPKPMIKRRASPLKESPARDEKDETSDCPMEQVADENPSASQQPEKVNMEQVDYDRDSDDDDSDEEGHPLAGRPLSKAMPHPKLVPKSPPPTLRLVPKVKPAPKNTLDDETESDNHPGDRPALPRRPVMRPVLTSNDQWFVTYGSDTNISLQKESVHPGPFGNSKFLSFVHEYYKECSTILDVNPDFHFVPEHGRPHGVKVFWLKARFNDYWHPTLQGEGPHAEKQYMDFIKKVYSICCYTNAQSEVYGTDIIPLVCHNGNIDLDKTVQNVEQVCKYFRINPSKAKQITDLILWRIERMSRSFSGCLRHDPRHGIHKECKRQVEMGPDGSVELYDALTCITHARNFIGNKPGLLLMAMFPSYGKSRFEIAIVFPSVDGTYNERKARGEIVPRNRWIDKLNTRSAQNALRPDGKEFYVDSEMEFYVRCNSGHARQVDIQSFGRPLYSEQKEPHYDEPEYVYQRNPFRQVRICQDPRRLVEMKAKLSPSTECEGRHHHPLKKRERSCRSRRSPSHSCSMQPMEVSSTASWSTVSNL